MDMATTKENEMKRAEAVQVDGEWRVQMVPDGTFRYWYPEWSFGDKAEAEARKDAERINRQIAADAKYR